MANERLDGVLHQIRRLVETEHAGSRTDRELLDCFVRQRDEAAFATLVRRHGPMVLGVCRRVLKRVHDTEDACQATFLILVRKAASIRKRDSLGSWLHGVAYRVACNLQRAIARRRARETPVEDVPQADSTDVSWREVRVVLDQELQRLPERFRGPLLLCYLEGKTRDEAAQELGWSVGTLRGRLDRGRELLRSRLARRGLTLSGALFASLLAQNASTAGLPPVLELSLVKTALLAGQPVAGFVSARVVALTAGVLKAMWMTKLKITAAVAVGVCLLGLGTLSFLNGALTAQSPRGGKVAQQEGPSGDTTAQDPDDRPPIRGKRETADAPERARAQAESRLNLKKLALAMHNFHDVYGHFPAPALYTPEKGEGAGGGGDARGGEGPGGPGGIGMGGSPGGPPGSGGPPSGLMRPETTPPTGPGSVGGGRPGMPGMGGLRPPGGSGMAPGGIPGGPGGVMGPGAGPRGGGSMGMPGMRPGMGGPGGGRILPGGMPGGPGTPGPGGGSGVGGGLVGGKGKALLSWRVALLPYLDEQELYEQFKLDEPWDGPHNKKLLKKMPKVYSPPGITTVDPYTTFYQVFVGEHAAFEKHRSLWLGDITDGTSNTILIVEGGSAVPWTKPEDLHYAADEPLPQLGGLFPDVFHAAFADGAVHTLLKRGDADTLRKAITRDDGFPLELDKIKASTSPRAAAMRHQNERLRQEIERVRAQLETLRREREVLQEADAETDRLREENEQLDQLLRKTRQETERLRDEIQRLKQPRDKRSGEPQEP